MINWPRDKLIHSDQELPLALLVLLAAAALLLGVGLAWVYVALPHRFDELLEMQQVALFGFVMTLAAVVRWLVKKTLRRRRLLACGVAALLGLGWLAASYYWAFAYGVTQIIKENPGITAEQVRVHFSFAMWVHARMLGGWNINGHELKGAVVLAMWAGEAGLTLAAAIGSAWFATTPPRR